MVLFVWKLLKYLGISLFASGLTSSFFSSNPRSRVFSGPWIASFGFLMTWLAGYGMMKLLGYKMSETWISFALLGSLVAMAAVLRGLESKFRSLLAGVACSAFCFCVLVMVFRTSDWKVVGAIILPISFFLGVLGERKSRIGEQQEALVRTEVKEAAMSWFYWLGRIEGTTLLLLFGLYMPLKYGAKINLDGGQGWFGWVHGIFQLLYLVALFGLARHCNFGWKQLLGGFFASLVPFGTFIFEHNLKKSES